MGFIKTLWDDGDHTKEEPIKFDGDSDNLLVTINIFKTLHSSTNLKLLPLNYILY